MLITYAIALSGILFAVRTTSLVVVRYHLLNREVMTKIGTCYCVMLVTALIFLSRTSVSLLWLLTFAPQVMFILAMFALRVHRTVSFRKRFTDSLSLLILKMRAGKGFRQALMEVITEGEPHVRVRLGEIRELVVFSPQQESVSETKFVRDIISEFRLADSSPHSALRRVQAFRDRLRAEDDFRRRSGQVLRQIRAQAVLLSSLYLAVLLFVIRSFGYESVATLVLMSVFLFVCGITWIWCGGRKLKWKV